MTISADDIHVCDDWLSCSIDNLPTIHARCDQLSQNTGWREVVPGLNSLAVQFDPAKMDPDQAAAYLLDQLSQPIAELQSQTESIEIPICYETEFAPDSAMIAEKLNLSLDVLPQWHSSQYFSVTMVGFMPGFAYLQCRDTVPDIGRLPTPRKKVPMGSIGIIGDQSCIYSFESPGGWPIIGRTPVTLFDTKNTSPSLLAAGHTVSFKPISASEFHAIASGDID